MTNKNYLKVKFTYLVFPPRLDPPKKNEKRVIVHLRVYSDRIVNTTYHKLFLSSFTHTIVIIVKTTIIAIWNLLAAINPSQERYSKFQKTKSRDLRAQSKKQQFYHKINVLGL